MTTYGHRTLAGCVCKMLCKVQIRRKILERATVPKVTWELCGAEEVAKTLPFCVSPPAPPKAYFSSGRKGRGGSGSGCEKLQDWLDEWVSVWFYYSPGRKGRCPVRGNQWAPGISQVQLSAVSRVFSSMAQFCREATASPCRTPSAVEATDTLSSRITPCHLPVGRTPWQHTAPCLQTPLLPDCISEVTELWTERKLVAPVTWIEGMICNL